MPRPRFRVRTIILAASLVALLIGGGWMGRRSASYSQLATGFETLERQWREIAARRRQLAGFGAECEAYYAEMARKYRQASRRPWLPVGPDPPAPSADFLRPEGQ